MLIALGLLYIRRENMVNRNSIPPDITVDSVYYAPIMESPTGAGSASTKIDLSTLLKPSKEQIARGEQLFKINCSSCHGTMGKGDGPASANLNPKPRDFHSGTGWINGRRLSQMFKTVSDGIPGSAMVSFAGALSPSDRIAVIDYIRTFSNDFPTDSPEEIEAMNKAYHLQEGETVSLQIPLSEAMRQIEEEAIPVAKSVAGVMSRISQDQTDRAALLFESVTTDEARALAMLAASGFWSKTESDFVMSVTANTIQNGFNPNVARLNAEDWDTLYKYLRDLFLKENIAEKNG